MRYALELDNVIDALHWDRVCCHRCSASHVLHVTPSCVGTEVNAMWVLGWVQLMQEWICPVCLAKDPRTRQQIESERSRRMRIVWQGLSR